MIVIGIDSHKRTHTAVAVDGTGRKLAERTLPATSAGHLELVRWAGRFHNRTWALEDCRHLSRHELRRCAMISSSIMVASLNNGIRKLAMKTIAARTQEPLTQK